MQSNKQKVIEQFGQTYNMAPEQKMRKKKCMQRAAAESCTQCTGTTWTFLALVLWTISESNICCSSQAGQICLTQGMSAEKCVAKQDKKGRTCTKFPAKFITERVSHSDSVSHTCFNKGRKITISSGNKKPWNVCNENVSMCVTFLNRHLSKWDNNSSPSYVNPSLPDWDIFRLLLAFWNKDEKFFFLVRPSVLLKVQYHFHL